MNPENQPDSAVPDASDGAESASMSASKSDEQVKAGIFRRTYDWVLHWAETPYGPIALFVLAVAESSFFPIPPEPLLLAVAFAVPTKAIRYGVLTTVGSVIGGALGYAIGYTLFAEIGQPIFETFGYMDQFDKMAGVFKEYNFLAVLAAAISPIPYKLFTITAGAVHADFWTFMLASVIGRGARFITEGVVIQLVGDRAREFVESQFGKLTWVFLGLLILGIVGVNFIWPIIAD